MSDILIRPAVPEDAAGLLSIYAPYVEDTAITFEWEVPSLEAFRDRMVRILGDHPYLAAERELLEILKPAEGNDQVIIYLRQEKAKKILPPGWRVQADRQLLAKLSELYGEKNVKVVEKTIEKIGKMN